MGYFPVRYNSIVVIYKHKMFIRLVAGLILSDGKIFPVKAVKQRTEVNVIKLFWRKSRK